MTVTATTIENRDGAALSDFLHGYEQRQRNATNDDGEASDEHTRDIDTADKFGERKGWSEEEKERERCNPLLLPPPIRPSSLYLSALRIGPFPVFFHSTLIA